MASVDLPTAPVTSVNPETWADNTCRDLLAVQAQNREVPPDQRADRVEQHLRERLSSVPEAQRRGCLRALATRFPLPDTNHAVASPPAAAAPATPESWIAAFDSIKDGITPEQQTLLIEKLRSAGCLPAPAAPSLGGIPVPPKLEALLPKEPGDATRVAAYDPAKVTELIDIIVEATLVLDGNFRRVWAGLAEFGKTDDGLSRYTFEEIMRKFLTGDQDVPRVVLKSHVESTTKLIPAVLMAVKQSWDALEADVGHCLPDEIQKRVPKGFRAEVRCWEEYTKAAQKLQPDSRVQEFFEQIVTKALARMRR
jgi:hypothetical protein